MDQQGTSEYKQPGYAEFCGKIISGLYDNPLNADIIFLMEGGVRIYAHSFVLNLATTYFQELPQPNEGPLIVHMYAYDPTEVQIRRLLRFIYQGGEQLTINEQAGLFRAMERFRVFGLKWRK